MTLIETVRAGIQAIRDIPNVTKAQRWHCKDIEDALTETIGIHKSGVSRIALNAV
jgi:hypothetical protein